MKKYIKVFGSDLDMDIDFSSFGKKDWIYYIANQWVYDGTPDQEIEAFESDMEWDNYEQWIDAIKDTLTAPEYRAFAAEFNISKDNDFVDVGDRQIYSRADAYDWLQEMTEEHGNTYFWDDDLKYYLNKLIDKFGNTYFWNN